VTDAGLKEVAALKNLGVVNLSVTKAMNEGVKELQKTPPY
jgi:hypothetical protein